MIKTYRDAPSRIQDLIRHVSFGFLILIATVALLVATSPSI